MVQACRVITAPLLLGVFGGQRPRPTLSQIVRRRALVTMAAASKTVLVPIANGTEEMEAVIVIDVLRRAGATVDAASVSPDGSLAVKCSRGVVLQADKTITECQGISYDMIVLPGGMPGAENLRDCGILIDMLKAQQKVGKPFAAICASPAVVLETHGLLDGTKRATVHPAFEGPLQNNGRVDIQHRVVVDGNVTTSRGPGTAFEFALTLVSQLFGKEKAAEVAGPMVMYPHDLP